MITPDMIVDAARRRLGTPWVHQGRDDAAGLDCVGLLVSLAAEFRLMGPDTDALLADLRADYGRAPDGRLTEALSRFLVPVAGPALVGDVLAFRMRVLPQHVGLLTAYRGGLGLIHCLTPEPGQPKSGGVKEMTFARPWPERVTGVYRWPVFVEA